MRDKQPSPPSLARGYVHLLAAAAVLLSSVASAQTSRLPSFELERLELNPDGQGSLVMSMGELLPEGHFRLSLTGHYEKNPLLLYVDGSPLGAVVSDRVSGHLLLAWTPLRWLELGAQIPLVVWQRGDDVSVREIASPATTGLGTPSAHVRVGLLSQRRKAPLDLALELGVGLPVGSTQTLSRDGTFRYAPKLMLGRRLGSLHVGAEAGVLLRPSLVLNDDRNINDELGNEVRLGVGASTMGKGLRGELSLRGVMPLSRLPPGVELLAGVRLPLGKVTEVYALGGPGFGKATGTPLFRVLLGIAFGGVEPAADLSELDDDGDGIKNGEDACPREAGSSANHGCPVKDSDDDGIIDSADKCPFQAGPPERQGCPVRDTPKADTGKKDSDGDGIDDDHDKCPKLAGPASRQGCPVLDSDGDGVVDERDKCPNEPGLVETSGCPARDSDGDSVADHLDNCPKEKGEPSNQGCPAGDKQMVAITQGKLDIKETVFFATGKATIGARSFRLLDQIARVISQHPEIEKVLIEGHSDNQGDAAKNRTLSRARAESVKKYLVDKGVEASRLDAQGFGPDKPIASNDTAQGRATNRRVVFSIITPDSK